MSGNAVKKNLIQVILGEVALEEGRGAACFRLNDDGVLSVIKKIKKSQEITLSGYKNSGRDVPESLIMEISILDTYLPKQLTVEQITAVVCDIIEEIGDCSMKSMGAVMNKFNSEFAGKADNKVVADIVKKRLT